MQNKVQTKEKVELLRSGKLSCLQNTQSFLAAIEKNNKNLNAVLEINKDSIELAKILDEKRKKGGKLGRFYGLCFIIKSNISIKSMFISCASKTLENYRGTYDADVVEKIKKEDGIIIAIANNDEFASGSSGEHSAFGPTKNPIVPSRIPGGSSSGSAASVAADFCDIALGSDTGGSIRNPASHCAIVGVKPSYGRVSRYGLVDLAMSFDQIGPFSHDVYGCALVMEVLSGSSKKDPTTTEDLVKKYSEAKPKKKYKIGVIKSFKGLVKDKSIEALFEKKLAELKKAGHEIKEIEIDKIDLAVEAYYPIVYTEFYSGTRKFDGIKYGKKIESSIGVEGLRRILGGREISRSEYDGAYYKKALKVKEIIAKEFEKAFKDLDFILTPVTPRLPHKLGTKVSVEEEYAYDAFTTPANLAGICGGVLPLGMVKDAGEEVPVGVQVLCDKFKEETLFEAMYLLEV